MGGDGFVPVSRGAREGYGGEASSDKDRELPRDGHGDGPDRDGVVNLRKLVRLSWMLGFLVEELRRVPLDECGRRHLRQVADQALIESGSAVTDDLLEELSRLAEPLDRDRAPTTDELRVVQAQLEGWIDGLIVAAETAAAARAAAAPVEG